MTPAQEVKLAKLEGEIKALDELARSPGLKLVLEVLEQRAMNEESRCESADRADMVALAARRAAAFREAMRIPGALLDMKRTLYASEKKVVR